MNFTFQPITSTNAEQIACWRYPAPYDFYNLDGHCEGFLQPAFHYHVAETGEGVIGAFLCWGLDARVAGFNYNDSSVDIGWGLKPQLAGRGFGQSFVQAAVLFASQKSQAARFRITVAQFNGRCRRVAESVGFVPVAAFARPRDGKSFDIMERSVTL